MFMWYESRCTLTFGSLISDRNSIACAAVFSRLVSYRFTTSSPSVTPLSAALRATLLSAATELARPCAVGGASYLPSAEYRMPHMYCESKPTHAVRASLSSASPRAAHSFSGDDTSASNERPRDVVALMPYSASTCLVMAVSTLAGSSNGISMSWYSRLAVLDIARRHSASLHPPAHRSACTPRGLGQGGAGGRSGSSVARRSLEGLAEDTTTSERRAALARGRRRRLMAASEFTTE
mmetsp:Transcript_23464/g.57482  ORF Transcript_23464/g.57482 Transcript_23464/m.57482 type:complete len:237 (-) Transcript_23464:200-910(-)